MYSATVITQPEPIALEIDAFMKRYKTPRRQKRMRPMYNEMIAEARAIAVPRLMFHAVELEVFDALPAPFKADALSAYLGLCTLGMGYDDRMAQLSQDDMALAAIFDEIGFTLVVGLARQIHALVKAEAAENNLKTGPAFRPGVGRMPLDLQNTVFANLDTQQIDVTLSEDLYMVPFKSTSLVIPVYAQSVAVDESIDLAED